MSHNHKVNDKMLARFQEKPRVIDGGAARRDGITEAYTHTIRQATLAPMAQAPAVPPRTALLEALAITSLKEGRFSSVAVAVLILVSRWCRCRRCNNMCQVSWKMGRV